MDLSSLTPEQRAQVEEKLKTMSPEEIAALQSQQSIFRQIVAGKIPSKKVYDDDKCMAILDIKPASKGHMLVLSKEYYAIMPQVPDDDLGQLLAVSKRLSLAALKGARATGSTILVANGAAAGQRVQDFMIHVIPRRDGDLVFEYPKQLVDLEKRRALRGLIAAKISVLTGKEDPGASEDEEAAEKSDGFLAPEGAEEVVEFEDSDESENSEEDDSDEETEENTDSEDGEDDTEEDDSEDLEEAEEVESSRPQKSIDLDDIANLF